jgi:hypothetical protein
VSWNPSKKRAMHKGDDPSFWNSILTVKFKSVFSSKYRRSVRIYAMHTPWKQSKYIYSIQEIHKQNTHIHSTHKPSIIRNSQNTQTEHKHKQLKKKTPKKTKTIRMLKCIHVCKCAFYLNKHNNNNIHEFKQLHSPHFSITQISFFPTTMRRNVLLNHSFFWFERSKLTMNFNKKCLKK